MCPEVQSHCNKRGFLWFPAKLQEQGYKTTYDTTVFSALTWADSFASWLNKVRYYQFQQWLGSTERAILPKTQGAVTILNKITPCTSCIWVNMLWKTNVCFQHGTRNLESETDQTVIRTENQMLYRQHTMLMWSYMSAKSVTEMTAQWFAKSNTEWKDNSLSQVAWT